MKRGARRPWSVVWIMGLVAMAALMMPACSDDDDDGGAQFTSSGTTAAPDLVRLDGTSVDGNTLYLEAVINGPTTSDDLFVFNIELEVAEAGLVEVVPGSAEPGDALSNALAIVGQDGQRITLGVTRQGSSGEQIPDGEHVLAGFEVDLVQAGATDISFDTNASGAETSDGTPAQNISFDDQPAQLRR